MLTTGAPSLLQELLPGLWVPASALRFGAGEHRGEGAPANPSLLCTHSSWLSPHRCPLGGGGPSVPNGCPPEQGSARSWGPATCLAGGSDSPCPELHTAPRSPGVPQHCLRKKITWPSRAEALAVAAKDTRPVYSPVLGGVDRYTGNSRGLPGPSPRLLSPAQTPSPLSAPHAPAPGAPYSWPQDAHDSQSPELLDKQDHSDRSPASP